MKLTRNRYWISGLVLVVALHVMVIPMIDAFVISLGEGLPQDAGVMRSSGAEVLYATGRDGKEVKLAGTDSPLGDGTPLDLGRPSEGPDGTVLFGAAFRSGNQVRWEVFAANPDTHAVSGLPLPTFHRARRLLSCLPTPRPWPKLMGRWCSPRRRTPTEKPCTN